MNTRIMKPLVLLLSLISFGALADTPVINDLNFLSNPSELAAAMRQPNWNARAAIIGQETGLSSLNQQIGQPWFKNKIEGMREVAMNDLSLLSDPSQLSVMMKQQSWPAKMAQMERETGLSSLGWQITQPWFKNKVSWAKVTLNNAGNSSGTSVSAISKPSDIAASSAFAALAASQAVKPAASPALAVVASAAVKPAVSPAPAIAPVVKPAVVPVVSTKIPVPQVFAPTSFWYTPIPTNVVLNVNSAQYQTEFTRQLTTYYGHVNLNTYGGASTIFNVPANQPTVKVTLKNCGNPTGWIDATLQAAFEAVPIPSYGIGDEGTDHEMTIYQPSTNTIWEFWVAQKVAGQWSACWGGKMENTNIDPGYFWGNYGATATSLPFLGGQITADELKNGVINHAIGISLQDTQNYWILSWPAQRSDGGNPSNKPYWIPEGTRFRLDPTINLDTLNLTPIAKTIAKAAQVYGFVVWDRSGGITIRLNDDLSYTADGGANPYPALFGKNVDYNLLAGFPWNHLQFLPMNYGKP